MVAEMELGLSRDRQRAGIDAAKARVVYKGRPATFEIVAAAQLYLADNPRSPI
jgi:DNA invertase Pin-like site-specific DNA recombinase